MNDEPGGVQGEPCPRDPTVLARNLTALDAFPGMRRAVEAAEPYPDDQVRRARSGDPVLWLEFESGAWKPVHSRYEPRREAARQLPEEHDPVGTAIFFGGGLGYGPLRYFEAMTSENLLVWVEPDPRIFRTALERVDLAGLLASEQVVIALAASGRDLHELLMQHSRRVMGAPVRLVSHPPTQQQHPSLVEDYRRAIQDFTKEAAVRLKTALYLSRYSLRNQLCNLGDYAASPGYEFLKGSLQGKPAILVAAGPSLRKNIDELRRAQGKLTIIAVSTAIRPLLQHGIRPDFGAIIDYHRVSRRYFEGIDPALAPPLIVDLRATPEALHDYPAPLLFGNDLPINTFVDGRLGDMGELAKGSTVAHVAFHFLRFLGADPVVLVGQDLSYPGGLIHVPGTAIQTQEFPSSHRFYSLEMRELEYYLMHRKKFHRLPGNLGGEVPTDDVFFSYVREFERIFQESGARILNATEGGARLDHTEVRTLASVLDEYADETRPDFSRSIAEELAGLDRAARLLSVRESIAKRRSELGRLTEIYDEMLAHLDTVVELNEQGGEADASVRAIHELMTEVKQYGRVYLLLATLAQSDGWKRIQDDRAIDAGDKSGVDKQLAQGRRDRSYVQGLREAATYLADCVERADASLERVLGALSVNQ